jgi:glycosyltransferase involved in cell wall biosynthesis
VLRALAHLSDVSLVCFIHTEGEQKYLEVLRSLVSEVFVISRESCRYRRNAQLPRPLGLLKALLEYCHPTQPVLVQAWESAEAVELARRLRPRGFDLVWGEGNGSERLVSRFPNARRVLDLPDVEHRKLGHLLKNGGLHPLMPLDAVEFLKLRRFERNLARRGYEVVVCSEVDKDALGGGPRVRVIPNGVELPPFPPQSGPPTDGHDLVFVGEMSYPPNVDAVKFFARKILPGIRREISDARFLIVGRNPDPSVRTLHDGSTIIVTGSVPDVEPYLRQATLVVVPIRFGGGTRLKILEAMAYRKAVVSTSAGAEGIEAESGSHLLLANDPRAFANACLRALRDENLRKNLTVAAYRLVSEKYQWSQIELKMRAMFQSTVPMGRSVGAVQRE